MKIHEDMRIIDLQSEFNSKFQHLKLEFYNEPHKEGEGSTSGLILDPYKKVKEVSNVDSSGELVINPEMTVVHLEKILADQFGLNAQVFRKSQGIWLQTTATDEWTLSQQNEAGKRA
ncbi:MAG: hypothetical protein GVX78_00220 [Bacteroidetes bacterium]|jgi:hypothetical protein|nr:hypothetical protein [Bacteroidota bacterium]